MIQHIQINGKEYPVHFSFRAVFSFMNHSNIDSIEAAEQQIALDLDSLLELYEEAFKKGADKDESFDGEPLSAEEIEDAFDEEPQLFMELQELFNESKVVKSFSGEAEKK